MIRCSPACIGVLCCWLSPLPVQFSRKVKHPKDLCEGLRNAYKPTSGDIYPTCVLTQQSAYLATTMQNLSPQRLQHWGLGLRKLNYLTANSASNLCVLYIKPLRNAMEFLCIYSNKSTTLRTASKFKPCFQTYPNAHTAPMQRAFATSEPKNTP